MRSASFLILLALSLGLATGKEGDAAALEVGSAAPEVTGTDHTGKEVDFAKLYGKGLTVVFFYPKAMTPG